ncbi:MAG: hypothetical protein WCA83_07360, partial [Azonexus sp.]
VMVCPPKGLKVDLDNQPLTMTTRLLSTADTFAHKSAHYPILIGRPCVRSNGFTDFTGHATSARWGYFVDVVPVFPPTLNCINETPRTPMNLFKFQGNCIWIQGANPSKEAR